MKTIIISDKDSGQRFDKYLKKLFRAAAPSFLYKMLRKKNILLNGVKASGSEILKEKDEIRIFFSDETFDKMCGNSSPEEFALLKAISHEHVKPVFENEDILAVNKPAGIACQKNTAGEISLNEECISYLIHEGGLTEESYHLFHPSVANRLDFNTTGIVLVGKSLKGQQILSECLKNRNLKKTYHAIVKGRITKSALLEGFLTEAEGNQVKISDIPFEGSREIKTAYEPLLASEEYTLLAVDLLTGRKHQIRAHLASIGHPVIGDYKYGDRKANQAAKAAGHPYQLLHAYSVVLPDGSTIIAPEPDGFRDLLEN